MLQLETYCPIANDQKLSVKNADARIAEPKSYITATPIKTLFVLKCEYIQMLRKVIGIGLNICAMMVMFT